MVGYGDRSSIAKVEAGQVDLTKSKIYAFAKALNTSPAQIMGMDDPIPGAFPVPDAHKIPLLGHIAAGLPLYAEENLEGYIWTDHNHGAEYFGLRVNATV